MPMGLPKPMGVGRGSWVSMTTLCMPGWARNVHCHHNMLWENYYYSQDSPLPVAGGSSIRSKAVLLQHSCSFQQITLWSRVQNTMDICFAVSGTSACWLATAISTLPCSNLCFLRILQRLQIFCSLVIYIFSLWTVSLGSFLIFLLGCSAHFLVIL